MYTEMRDIFYLHSTIHRHHYSRERHLVWSRAKERKHKKGREPQLEGLPFYLLGTKCI